MVLIPEDMEQATYKDWINDVEHGLERLQKTCSKIFIVGLSMGGTLTYILPKNMPNLLALYL